MHNFVVHSNESACRKSGCLGMDQVIVSRHLGAPDTKVGCFDQSYDNPNIYLSTYLIVGMFPFRRDADGCMFKRSLRLYSKEAFHQCDKGEEVAVLPETRLHILLLPILIWRLEKLLCQIFPLREDFIVHNMHIMNIVCPSLLKATNQKVSLLLWVLQSYVWIFVKWRSMMGLSLPHWVTWMD